VGASKLLGCRKYSDEGRDETLLGPESQTELREVAARSHGRAGFLERKGGRSLVRCVMTWYKEANGSHVSCSETHTNLTEALKMGLSISRALCGILFLSGACSVAAGR
jgi:hypothetical protein